MIADDGKQLGIVAFPEALKAAKEKRLDLVEVAPDSDPPVCRIMDYGKFKYQSSKKGLGPQKKSHSPQLKEIKLRPHTEAHDLGFKLKHLKKFLAQKDRVKVSVFFRGREMAYLDEGRKILARVAEEIMDVGKIEQPPTQEARNRMTMVIIPK